MSDHKRLKKIKYREDLQLSEYVRSLFIAFVEAELLSAEVRVFEANFLYFLNGGQSIWRCSHDKSGKSEKTTFHAATAIIPK